ncbi:uncharacterized protein I303_108361 [Kwoniella dejecticola CBS 10117]|uniref:Uncharacterized protein n=1 Tax=Kwoniella dejecticola CBS 10117 TaxID=1296121 RepID=A0A1A5ZXL5_9TREE|nr:uncharacterized protein I303_07311 [Kwoniella dejecticola CBS 10117]OBR82551.1 hypothetical protein I303_07311 [Kwoniella dejecticola CBS 10117]
MPRDKWNALTLTFIISAGVSVLLMPFAFFLVVSFSPNYIHALSLAWVESKVIDGPTQQLITRKISVGPAGGCMWYNSSISKCDLGVPYVPSSEYLHLAPNQNVTSTFPVAMGRALPLNHVVVILMGLCLTVALLDIFFFKGGIALYIIYFSGFMLWIVYFLESTYVGTLSHRLDKIYEHEDWEYHAGNGFILITVATFVASIFLCGGGAAGD